MKRRSFLTMLGAAITAPAIPMGASSVPANIGKLAATHARTYPFVSATGLSKRLGLSIGEAQQLLIDLSRKGIVGTVHSCNTGPIHAASKVFKPSAESLLHVARMRVEAQKLRAAKAMQATAQATVQAATRISVDLAKFMPHLRIINAPYDSQRPHFRAVSP